MSSNADEIALQRDYYVHTAGAYDAMHVDAQDEEHGFALAFLTATIDHLKVRSVLDIGSGTGRALRHLKEHCPQLRVMGIEPVRELREVGHANGLGSDELIDGDATVLLQATGSFDLVCEFGALHHIKRPERAVAEMLRVARRAVFISDCNNFGQGSATGRGFKQLLDLLGLWRLADLVKTRGKGYTLSEGDGLAYSYSVFNNYRQIRAQCERVHLLNTRDGGVNPYRSASHVALLGIKPERGPQHGARS